MSTNEIRNMLKKVIERAEKNTSGKVDFSVYKQAVDPRSKL